MRKLHESEKSNGQLRGELQQSEQKAKGLEVEIARLNAQLQSTQGQLQQELNDKIRENEQLKQKITELESNLKTTRREAEATKGQLEATINKL